MRFFQGPHTQYRAHHSKTRVCARLIGLSYAQLRERREFGRRGGFGEVACCVLSGDHVCGVLSVCAVTVESIEYQPVSGTLLLLISARAMRTCFYESGLATDRPAIQDSDPRPVFINRARLATCFALESSTPPKTTYTRDQVCVYIYT